jgi:cytochrome b561
LGHNSSCQVDPDQFERRAEEQVQATIPEAAMAEKKPATRYPSSAIAIHWMVLLLIVAAYACILLRENYPRGSELREALKVWHFSLGLTILAITALRVVLRSFLWDMPPITPPVPPWLTIPAAAAHAALYVLLLAMPIAGWLILSAEGDPIRFWGVDLPALMAPNKELAEQIKEIHETGGTVGYVLIGAHALAALAHHYLFEDNTLVRMLPGKH